MMIERFKPGLILLDNYLPDGRGINLLHELVQAHYPGDVVFTTAASDMETVSEAVRCGVFDYLIKPIAYERLGQTLTRFRQRKHMLESIDSASQKQIDEMFNAYARGEPKDEHCYRCYRADGARNGSSGHRQVNSNAGGKFPPALSCHPLWYMRCGLPTLP